MKFENNDQDEDEEKEENFEGNCDLKIQTKIKNYKYL